VLVFRYVCEVLINAVSGPFIDKLRIRTSLMTSDLLRTVLAVALVAAVLGGAPIPVYLALSFLGDFVFIFFKPATDKVVKVTFPVEEGTRALSLVDASNHVSNIAGYALASGLAATVGLHVAVVLGPLFFFLSFLFVSRLRLPGESAIDYAKVRKKSYWASQREGLRYTWESRPLRTLLIGRSLVAIGRGSFTVLSVAYLASIAKNLDAYGYFESSQTAGKIVVTLLVIPLFFAYRSAFLLTAVSLVAQALAFFGFNLVDQVTLACLVGVLVGGGQAAEAVGIDALLNRYADAHIQGRAKSTTSFGSRLLGLAAIGIVYVLVTGFHVEARSLFGYLGVFPLAAAAVFVVGWRLERARAAVAARPHLRLAVVEGEASQTTVELGSEPILIGRSRKNNIVLADDAVSRFHAVVRPEGSAWVIEDMRSSNGVLLDGVPVQLGPLVGGSRIVLGRTVLVIQDVASAT